MLDSNGTLEENVAECKQIFDQIDGDSSKSIEQV